MNQGKGSEFIDELRFCLKQEDIVKGKALLQFVTSAGVETDAKVKAIADIAKKPDHIALPLLECLTQLDVEEKEVNKSLFSILSDKAFWNTDLFISKQYLNLYMMQLRKLKKG